jgi:AraC-like DNA-binding protein
MIIPVGERQSDSPYIETVTNGYTASAGSTIRPAESHWHMVVVRVQGKLQLLVVGALPQAGSVSWGADAEILWIKFRLGVFMPHLPVRNFVDNETPLPGATSCTFWLKGSAWQYPSYENVETFIDRLVRAEALVCDLVVDAALQGQSLPVSPRTVRHRFLQATGLSHNEIRQIERAQQAAASLRQGVSILDTVHEFGYFDQPHLTRSLKRWVGYTPAQLFQPPLSDLEIR